MTDITLETLRAELAPIRQELAIIRPCVDGIPLIGAAIETLRHDVRTLRAAINDHASISLQARSKRCMRISTVCRASR